MHLKANHSYKSTLLLLALLTYPPLTFAADVAHETQGLKFTVLPLAGFSSDDGPGYGIKTNLYDYDGSTVPYRIAISAQAFFTTKGKWSHRFKIDFPEFRPGNRVEFDFRYDKEDFATYFGELSDSQIEPYTKSQQTFQQRSPTIGTKWIRTLRHPWQIRASFIFGRYNISPNSEDGGLLATLSPLGFSGGNLLQLQSALRYDTRDNYNNATGGVLEEFLFELDLGRGSRGGQISYEHQHFLSFQKGLTLAQRLQTTLTLGDMPFYIQPKLGSSRTVRGIPPARVRGEGRLLLNSELRWTGIPLSLNRKMYAGLVFFVDTGQVFRRSVGPSLRSWKTGAGVGLRLFWYSTITRVDYGASKNDTGLYVRFSQSF